MLLSGSEVAGFIKARQAKQVRQLKGQAIQPKLAIIKANQDAASSAYIGAKQKYGADIGIAVEIYDIESAKVAPTIKELNAQPSVNGIIVQLPLPKGVNTDEILGLIDEAKDVDNLTGRGRYDSPTPTAILWLLAGYDIELKGKTIAIVGQGRLVGEPLAKILETAGHKLYLFDDRSKSMEGGLIKSDVIIAATGIPRLITSAMVKPGAVVIDAGTAEAGGKLVGDVDPTLYKRTDLKIAPVPGGVGPLTVCALFENVLKAAGSGK